MKETAADQFFSGNFSVTENPHHRQNQPSISGYASQSPGILRAGLPGDSLRGNGDIIQHRTAAARRSIFIALSHQSSLLLRLTLAGSVRAFPAPSAAGRRQFTVSDGIFVSCACCASVYPARTRWEGGHRPVRSNLCSGGVYQLCRR